MYRLHYLMDTISLPRFLVMVYCGTVLLVYPSAFSTISSSTTTSTSHQPHQEPVSGLYSKHLKDYHVVVPRKVDSDGEFLSHSLVHHHEHTSHPRERRDTSSSRHPIYFVLPTESEELLLELWPSTNFLAPGLMVQRPLKHQKSAASKHTPTSCHYQGHVKGDPHSSVAISACHGLAGMVRSRRHGELWVEPVLGMTRDHPEEQHPHVVYRRSAGPTPSKKRRKKKRASEKNCGTREPRRVVQLLKDGEKRAGKKARRRGASRQNNARVRWRRAVFKSVVSSSERLQHEVEDVMLHSGESIEDDTWWHSQEKSAEETTERTTGSEASGFSESIERHVEALVVADRSMIDFHTGHGGDVEIYLLTIMNMVSSFFRDPSIGNRINIVVVKLAFMDEAAEGVDHLNVTVNADATLESFCNWQMANNHPSDDHANHHDVAILVTRVDICARSNDPCGTLGVAHVAGMCHPRRSCSVNQDNGLAVAHTITHEMGHNFGMVHDAGVTSEGCGSREGSTLHVMTASFETDTEEVAWSPCSRKAITRFLDQGGGECLRDSPTSPEELQFDTPTLPPGAMYDADYQCKLQFNSSATGVCSAPEEICFQLWCIVDGNCATMLRPPADGTNCGHHKWCMARECVELRDTPAPVHGAWGEWGSWSPCSRTCGGGVASTERECDHPRPAHNGNYCLGRRKRYQVCNVQPCPEGELSYRAVQCANYVDPKLRDGDTEQKWIPYFDKSSPCILFCTDAEHSVVVEASHAAYDGTPCNSSARDMCIDGRCRRVGCDWRVDSGAEEDMCGVCRGDGSLCETVSSEFMTREGSGYVEAAVIPQGARNLRVEEMAASRTFIALASLTTDHHYIDGKRWRSRWSGECEVAGSPGLYERWADRETLTVRGPINETLRLYVVFHGRYRNFGVHYEYTIRRRDGEALPEFDWRFPDWSACSATCGGGLQVARPVCWERLLGQVDDARCEEGDAGPAPGPRMRACAMPPCPASWWTGPWQLCPVTCGPADTRRHRSVLCVRASSGQREQDEEEDEEVQALPDSECEGRARPQESEHCPGLQSCQRDPATKGPELVTERSAPAPTTTRIPTPRFMRRHRKREEVWAREQALILRNAEPARFMWLTGNWGECGRRCGGGSQRRGVTCHLASSGHRVGGRHCPKPKPIDHEPCNLRPCEAWLTSPWGKCSAPCGGEGWRARKVECSHPPHCDPMVRPSAAEPCINECH